MFRSDLAFKGSHAIKANELRDYKGNDKLNLFPRYIDIYMIAPLIGVIFGEKEPLCNKNNEHRSIMADTVNRHYDELNMIYQLVLLFDEFKERPLEDRIYRAFRDFANREHNNNHKNNMETFNSYVRGGISVLHDKITKDAYSFEDYVKNYHDFIIEFKNEFIEKQESVGVNG